MLARVSFGADRTEAGHLLLRIRSRARQANLPRYLGYEILGKHVQTKIWTAFLECLARECGGRPLGDVVTSTDEVAEDPADRGETDQPTF